MRGRLPASRVADSLDAEFALSDKLPDETTIRRWYREKEGKSPESLKGQHQETLAEIANILIAGLDRMEAIYTEEFYRLGQKDGPIIDSIDIQKLLYKNCELANHRFGKEYVYDYFLTHLKVECPQADLPTAELITSKEQDWDYLWATIKVLRLMSKKWKFKERQCDLCKDW
jgi:hypothetical protein